ncbi:MAG: hypothetical protein LBT09_12810 [Planctomycetaceae bacterium]|jgi:hypothetical protein|nr:hypothetical protein [Planctomycetaceae bacterium]
MKSLNFVLGSVLSAVLFVVPALGNDTLDLESIERISYDSVFEQYVDIDLLADAWDAQDAAGLVDAALQFAKGEKELFRQHKVFASQKLFNTALRIAADKKDTVTLERLEKIAKAIGDETFASKVASTAKLSAASRSIIPAECLAVEKDNSNGLSWASFFSGIIERFRYLGDEKSLEIFEKNFKQIWDTNDDLKKNLSKEQVDSLVKLSGESRAAIAQTPQEDVDTAYELEKLSGESRVNLGRVWDHTVKKAWDNTRKETTKAWDRNKHGVQDAVTLGLTKITRNVANQTNKVGNAATNTINSYNSQIVMNELDRKLTQQRIQFQQQLQRQQQLYQQQLQLQQQRLNQNNANPYADILNQILNRNR